MHSVAALRADLAQSNALFLSPCDQYSADEFRPIIDTIANGFDEW
jgi:hypothetical protein